MLAALTDDEKALFSILTDPAGIDLAEFAWVDENAEDKCWRARPYQWCFAGETQVVTKQGHRAIRDLVGNATLLTEDSGEAGKWVDAEVKAFGQQPIVELDIERYGVTKTLRTTAEHRWFADARPRRRREYPEVKTIDLMPGMYLKSVRPHRSPALKPREWRVVRVRCTGQLEEVYCAVVPGSHSFVLDGYILTGNCWWRNRDERQIDLCGRDLGKSLGTAMRTCSFPFRWPGGQRAIFAPSQNHLDLLTKVIEDRVAATWLTRQMLKGGRQSIIHSPRFEIVFLNRTQVVGCIPGVGGRGFKGVHAEELEVDEGQDLDEAAWKETFSTVKRHVKGWRFLIHGVTKGVQDTFYRLTLHKSGWTVHRRVGMHRETWTDQERQQFEDEFGGPESPDYKRNILGLHGDASSPLFPLAQLMSCTDDNELSDYNTKEYKRINITGEDVGPLEGDIVQFLDYPIAHTGGKYQRFWAGMDIGRTIAPSEILVLGEYRKGKSDDTSLRILLRVHMTRVLEPDQADVIRWLIEQYKPTAFAMDSGGVGHPIYQELKTRQERATLAAEAGGNVEEAAALRQVLDSIKGYDFGSKVPVGIMDPATEDLDLVQADDEPNYVFRNVKEASTDMLRLLVSENRLELPWDKDMIGQFQMATFSNNKTGVDEYGRTRRFSEGQDHVLDAARMAAMAYSNYKLEAMVKEMLRAKLQKPQEVFISMVGGSGW